MGTKIDNTDRANWSFPQGTILIKTFFDDSGAGGQPRAIETRLIRYTKTFSYEFFVYEWRADGSDADLLVDDINGLGGDTEKDKLVMVTIKRMVNGQPFMVNGGAAFPHSLPSRKACGDCHEQNGMKGQTFIGFDELRLNAKRTPTSAKTQLQEFGDMGIFMNPVPADPATLPAASTANDQAGRLARIKRFVFGNCVHCHHGVGLFSLHPDVFEMATVNKPTASQSVVPPAGWLRIYAQRPRMSVLYVQTEQTMIPAPTAGGTRLRPMPPVGVATMATDVAAVKDLFDWITNLPPR
jgi:hypothetical protein